MRFIDIVRQTSPTVEASTAALEICGDSLRVVGGLPHGTKFTPRTLADARALLDWAQGLVDMMDPASVRERGD